MDVRLDSPVNVQQSQSVTFSPPTNPFTLLPPPTPASTNSELPPPAHTSMSASGVSSNSPTVPEPSIISESTPDQAASSTPADTGLNAFPSQADLLALRNELAEVREHLAQAQAQLQHHREQTATLASPAPTETATRDTESLANDVNSNTEGSSTVTEVQLTSDDSDAPSIHPQDVPSTATPPGSEAPITTEAAEEVVAEADPASPEANMADPTAEASAEEPPPTADPADDPVDDSIDPSPLAAPDTLIATPPATAESELPDWLDIEEDTSAPDEEELKEIEASNEVSARDVKHHEESFYVDAPEDPEQQPLHKMRLTWVIKGVRGTKEKPNRARIMNSPTVYVGGYYWYLKFFPRGNNSSALSAYVKCSRREPKPDKEVPENTFSAVYGDADADLGQLEPAINMSISASDIANKKESKVEEDDSEANTEDMTKKTSEGAAAAAADTPHDNSANASDDPAGRTAAAEEEEEDNGEDWRASAQIGIILYNPDEPRTKFDMSACHQFNKHNDDWGWTNFHGPWSEIHKRRSGQRQALLRNDTLALDAYVRIFNDPSQALWWHHCGTEEQWDSVALTGYPAFGASTYHSPAVAGITSWLLLAPFRAIFEALPASTEDRVSLCSQLQMVLFLMRKQRREEKNVSLTPLVEMLDRIGESGTDVATFWEGFRRSLELELQSVPKALDQIADIFDAKPTADAEDVRTTALKIPVQGVSSIQIGLEKTLSRDSSKREFPKFLTIELERQKFDAATREWKLLYDRVGLSEELDLSQWCTEPERSKYTLYGFVVHVDERNSGEFYSILRPNGPGTKWLAFEDGTPDQVISYTSHKILEFEGLEGDALSENKSCRQTAYLAMYIRSDLVKDFLPGILNDFDLAPWLRDCSQVRDLLDSRDIQPYELEATPEVKLAIYPSGGMSIRRGLVDIKDLMDRAEENVKYLTVPAGTTWHELRHKLARWNGIDSVENIKMWIMEFSSPGSCLNSAFKRISRLNKPIQDYDAASQPHRIWMHVLASPEEVKLFGDPDQAPDEDAFEVNDAEDPTQELGHENVALGSDASGEAEAPLADVLVDEVALPPTIPADTPSAESSHVTSDVNPDSGDILETDQVAAADEGSTSGDVATPAGHNQEPLAMISTVETSADGPAASAESGVTEVNSTANASSTDQNAHSGSDVHVGWEVSERADPPADNVEPVRDVSAEDESLIASLIAQDVEQLEETAEASVQSEIAVQTPSVENVDDGGEQSTRADTAVDGDEAQPRTAEQVAVDNVTIAGNGEPVDNATAAENIESADDAAAVENREGAENVEMARPTPASPPAIPGETSNGGGNEEDEVDEDDNDEDDDVDDDARSDSSDEEEGRKGRPMPFYYGFIQLFNAQEQDFAMVGDFIAHPEDNVKEIVRKQLEYPEDKNFLVWRRGDAYRLTSVQGTSTFDDIRDDTNYRYDGFILVVGDVLSDSTKASLTAASSFRAPEPLSQYLWFSKRKHPVKAYTGDITISSFGLDYYSGRLLKGLYSGQGTHITSTGHSYTGPFLAGSRSTTTDAPKGSCQYSNGDTYTGGWSNDERDGQGEFVEKRTGNKYVGGYQNGKRWGKGTTYWEVADEEGEMCQICYSEGEDALFYDCGHVCACVECAKQVDVCPICRKAVQQVVKIWKA